MPLKIRHIKSPIILDKIFQKRHLIFAQENKYLKQSLDKRIVDRFDALLTTANFAVLDGDEVVGGVRFTLSTEGLTPVHEYNGFQDYIDRKDIAAGSMIFMDKAYRGVSQATRALLDTGLSWALARGSKYVIAVGNPKAKHFFCETGHQIIGPESIHKSSDLPFIPFVLDLEQNTPNLWTALHLSGVQMKKNEINLNRWLLKSGDEIPLNKNDNCQYVIISGIACWATASMNKENIDSQYLEKMMLKPNEAQQLTQFDISLDKIFALNDTDLIEIIK